MASFADATFEKNGSISIGPSAGMIISKFKDKNLARIRSYEVKKYFMNSIDITYGFTFLYDKFIWPWVSVGFRNSYSYNALYIPYGEIGCAFAFFNLGIGYSMVINQKKQINHAPNLFIGILIPVTDFNDLASAFIIHKSQKSCHFYIEPYYRPIFRRYIVHEMGILFKIFIPLHK